MIMTDTNQTSTTSKNRPTQRLVQEKAYYKTDGQGRQVREVENIEITRGWDQIGRDSGVPYISWANTTIPIFPDVDGKITLRTFQITYEDES